MSEEKKELATFGNAVAPKTLHNSDASGTKINVPDVQFFGNGDTFRLICKASSANEGWMKSCKAMEIPKVGCVIQVTTQQGSNVAEALVFVPGTRINTEEDGTLKVVNAQY